MSCDTQVWLPTHQPHHLLTSTVPAKQATPLLPSVPSPQAMLPAPELWAVPKTTVAQAVDALAVVKVEALAAAAQAMALASAPAPAPAPAVDAAAQAGSAAPAPAA